MSEEQKLDDLMEDLDEQDKKPYETEVVGTGQYGSDGGVGILVEGVISDCFYANGASVITFPGNAKIIRERAVKSVGDIHDIGFYCNTLRIPAGIVEIEPGAFSNLEAVDHVEVDANNPNYKAVDDVIFTKDGRKLIYCPPNMYERYEVPEGTEEIVAEAFYYGRTKCITIPESVKTIDSWSFFESDLEEIRGVPGSYAEEYADSQGFLFVDVNKEEDVKRNPFAKRLFDVVLVEAGSDRMAVIKLLKKECGMGMADAKAAMDFAPTVIKKGLEKYAAQSLVSQFADVGAKMKVQ